MARETFKVEGRHFTSLCELAREVREILARTDFKLIVQVNKADVERLAAEFRDERLMSRVVIKA